MKKIKPNKDKWCEYCGDGKDKSWAECWTVGKQNEGDALVTIKFCPMCGRKLNA